jgi:hypothetical protein
MDKKPKEINENFINSEKNALIKDSVLKAKEILSDAKNQKNYQSNTLFESAFASLFNKMPLEQLEGYRTLMNKIIAERKITSRIISATAEMKKDKIKKDK